VVNSPTITVTWDGAIAENCPDVAPIKTQPPPPNTATHTVTLPITMAVGGGGNKYTGETTMAGQPFEVILSSGRLEWTNTGGDQPIICDGNSALGGQPDAPGSGSSSNTVGDSGGGSNMMYGVAAIVVLLAVGGAVMYKKNKATTSPPPPASAGGGMYPAAAPPPPPSNALPAGWSEMRDPGSGAAYFYNANTGETTWTKPNFV